MKHINCEYCDTCLTISKIEHGYEYHCPTCNGLIYRPNHSKLTVTILSLSTLITFFWAVQMPLLDVYIISKIQVSILDSILFLFKTDVFSGVVLLFSVIAIPIFMVFLVLMILYSKQLKLNKKSTKKLVWIYKNIKDWNTIEVYFIGVLIALIKLVELADVEVVLGFWVNIIYVVLMYLTILWFNPDDTILTYEKTPIDNYSILKVSIFLILALIFIWPSNVLPIMPTYKYSVEYPNTIYDGIHAFYVDGDYFISFVIFFASICIPILKIVGLFFMILMVKFNLFSNHKLFATKYYRATDVMGKYSMLDVYVVVLAASFVQYDDLLRIEIGEAIIPFTLVVFFTMIASKLFDTRLLWRENVQTNS
jgi:paraquat-inducible protein A